MTDSPRTLSDKIWERHVVHSAPGEPDLLYIDLHLIHEIKWDEPGWIVARAAKVYRGS